MNNNHHRNKLYIRKKVNIDSVIDSVLNPNAA